MKNELKDQVKEGLKKEFSDEVVAKGILRGERWMAAAYGYAGINGWQERFDECGGLQALILFFQGYCKEIKSTQKPGDSTFNRKNFGRIQ